VADPSRRSTYSRNDPQKSLTSHNPAAIRSNDRPSKKTSEEKSNFKAIAGSPNRNVTSWGHTHDAYKGQIKKFDKLADKPEFMKAVERRKNVLQYGTEAQKELNMNTSANQRYRNQLKGSMGDMMKDGQKN